MSFEAVGVQLVAALPPLGMFSQVTRVRLVACGYSFAWGDTRQNPTGPISVRNGRR